MRRLLPIFALIVVAASPFAQTSPPPSQTDAHPESTCSVEGRVVSAIDGSALKSAKLTLVPEHDARKAKLYAAVTDGDGHFVLKDVVPGRYQFAAIHAGFCDPVLPGEGRLRGGGVVAQTGRTGQRCSFSHDGLRGRYRTRDQRRW